jgi:hypothetical protein
VAEGRVWHGVASAARPQGGAFVAEDLSSEVCFDQVFNALRYFVTPI